MPNTGIALIVAGTGDTTADEVFDLLEDSYPEGEYDIGLVFSVDKDLFTKSVENVLDWGGDSAELTPVQTKGAAMSRKSSKIEGIEKVDSFLNTFNKSDFDGWDEVHFIVAMPGEDAPEDEYNLYAEMVERAIDEGIPVKDLTAGLDDVRLADDEPEPEPEPEPEKPKRKSRARKAPEPEVEEAKPEPKDLQEELAEAAHKVGKQMDAAVGISPVSSVLETLARTEKYLRLVDESNALVNQADEVKYRPLTLAVAKAFTDLADFVSDPNGTAEPTETQEKPKASSKGRGRPRTNFEVKQIQDDEGDWIPRPKGRVKKGTPFRTIHAETDEVLEEGVV